jgi:pimeloyl-ACP methyl ester carboxylesterase
MSWKSTNWEEKWHCGHHHLFWDGLIALIEQEKQDYAFHQFYEGAFRGMKLDDLTQWIKSMFESASPEAALGGLRELRDKDITTSVGKIRIPTRIISGWTDVLVPFTLADVQQNLIAGATLTKLVAGHGLFFEKADELNLALMGELRQIPECPVDYCPVRWVVGKRT